jgi:hypothetical protein
VNLQSKFVQRITPHFADNSSYQGSFARLPPRSSRDFEDDHHNHHHHHHHRHENTFAKTIASRSIQNAYGCFLRLPPKSPTRTACSGFLKLPPRSYAFHSCFIRCLMPRSPNKLGFVTDSPCKLPTAIKQLDVSCLADNSNYRNHFSLNVTILDLLHLLKKTNYLMEQVSACCHSLVVCFISCASVCNCVCVVCSNSTSSSRSTGLMCTSRCTDTKNCSCLNVITLPRNTYQTIDKQHVRRRPEQ